MVDSRSEFANSGEPLASVPLRRDRPFATPKSGNDWTQSDLNAFNIVIEYVDRRSFFGRDQLPDPQIDREVLTVERADQMVNWRNSHLINLLDFAMTPVSGGTESHVTDFAGILFLNIGYLSATRVAQTRRDLPLLMSGRYVNAQTDVCIVDREQNDILLLVQEDKRFGHENGFDPEPQLVAEALAAFQFNNSQRKLAGRPVLSQKEIPGIIMIGTSPMFYRIPITSDLIRHVQDGNCPRQQTVILVHVPDIPRPNHRLAEGMKPLDNRGVILQYYEAFKMFVQW